MGYLFGKIAKIVAGFFKKLCTTSAAKRDKKGEQSGEEQPREAYDRLERLNV